MNSVILFQQLKTHFENGFDIESFPPCSRKTLHRYMADFPSDFPALGIKKAKRTGRLSWMEIAKKGITGEIKKFNAAAWSIIMMNMYDYGIKKDIIIKQKTIEKTETLRNLPIDSLKEISEIIEKNEEKTNPEFEENFD